MLYSGEAVTAPRFMSEQRPGRSVQIVGTPDDFLDAFEDRFGPIVWDLAATAENCVRGVSYYGPGSICGEDSLLQDWSLLPRGNLWLNPEFGKIAPWAKKSTEGGDVNLFVPLSSSKWAARHCWGVGMVYPLFPRIVFKGHTASHPKDMMLVRYGAEVRPGAELWRWK